MKAHRTQTTVSEDGSVTLRDLPFAEGEAVEVIVIERARDDEEASEPRGKPGTAEFMARSPLVGLWKDRDDIEDSVAFARRLRKQAQQRSFGKEEDE